MKKRQLILNGYKTAEDGLFTLTACKITKASQEQSFVSVPGRFAPLDLSTVLTDGQPYYGNASLDAVLESSEGTRAERQERIDHLVNLLDGYTAKIIHPDFPGKYMVGRVEVTPGANGLAYCTVAISAVLEPWLYNEDETVMKAALPHYEEGKNLLDLSSIMGVSTTMNGGTLSCGMDGGITGSGTPTEYMYILSRSFTLPVGTYTFSMTGNAVAFGGTYTLRDKDRNVLDTYTIITTDPSVTINLANYPTYNDVVLEIKRTANNVEMSGTSYFQLERGTTATEYKPYTNAGGKNLLDIPDTTVSGSHAYTVESVGDFELPSGTYTLSAHYVHKGAQIGQISVREYGTLDGYLNTVTLQAGTIGEAKVTFTVPEGVQGVRIYLYSNVSATPGNTSVTISDIMVNEGSAALEYEPYYPLGDQLLTLTNKGRLAEVPVVDVTGAVSLNFDDKIKALSAGTYQLPDLYLTPGKHFVTCSGEGTVTVTYREAVLAG